MKTYSTTPNYVEHELGEDKYLLKICDGDVIYPKLYILNTTSYDIYKFVSEHDCSELCNIVDFLLNKYPANHDIIRREDIERCVNDFVEVGIFSSNEA